MEWSGVEWAQQRVGEAGRRESVGGGWRLMALTPRILNAPTPDDLSSLLRGFLVRLASLDGQLTDLTGEPVPAQTRGPLPTLPSLVTDHRRDDLCHCCRDKRPTGTRPRWRGEPRLFPHPRLLFSYLGSLLTAGTAVGACAQGGCPRPARGASRAVAQCARCGDRCR